MRPVGDPEKGGERGPDKPMMSSVTQQQV